MNENIEEITYRYRKKKIGKIAKMYSNEEEQVFYENFSDIISNKYGNIISKEKIMELISKRGKIFSLISMGKRCGFFEYETGNIGVNHLLKELSDDLTHELVHKLSYFQNNSFFGNMSHVFLEAGTEIVSARALSSKISRLLIFENAYSIFPDRVSDNYLAINLTNQINEALGKNTLEQSILKGYNIFETEIKERWGEESLIYLRENIEDVILLDNIYWENRKNFSSNQKQAEENKLLLKVSKIQDFILEKEFDTRLTCLSDYLDAQKFLSELLEFGNTRIKNKEIVENEKFIYTDSNFKKYFSKCKNVLERKFGEIDISFNEKNWQKLCEYKEIDDSIIGEEDNEILILAERFAKEHKRKGKFRKIFEQICGLNKRVLISDTIKENKFEDYRVDITQRKDISSKTEKYEEQDIVK